eukprot:5473537-Prymnesium_polylepis.1
MPVCGAVDVMKGDSIDRAYNQARLLLPTKLQQQMVTQLKKFDSEMIAELKGYKERPSDELRLLKAVLVILGKKDLKKVKKWEQVKPFLKPALIDEMIALDAREAMSNQTMRKLWTASERYTADMDMDYVLLACPQPIKVMTKWLLALRLVCQVVLTVMKEDGFEVYDDGDDDFDDVDDVDDDVPDGASPKRGLSFDELMRQAGEV